MVKMEKQAFIINGSKEFIYGGEFHYFRCPKKDWEDRVEKIKEAGCNLVSTYIPWYWHEINEGEIDLTGITRPERDLESFLKLLKEKEIFCIVRPGPYVMAEIRNEGIPEWLLETYPEIIARTKEGKMHPTRVVSYLHPVYLEKVKIWYENVCKIISPYQVTNDGTVYMFQLDNEAGMLQWVTNTSEYNDVTLKYFCEYLEKTYGKLYEFNEIYDVQVESYEEFTKIMLQNECSINKKRLHFDWGRFMREYIKRYIEILKDYSKLFGINVPYIVNAHGFKDISTCSRGFDYPIGLSQLYETTKIEDVVLAGDFYIGNLNYNNFHDLILAGAYTQAIQSPDNPYFSAEFQSGRGPDRPRIQPQDIDLLIRTCIANGMNAVNYYMFVSGENYENIGLFSRRHDWQAPIDLNGNFRPHYYKIQNVGKMIKAFSNQLLETKKEISTHIGFYPDYYMTEYCDEEMKEIVNEISFQRDHYQFDGVCRLLCAANIQFNALDVMQNEIIDVESVPSLWMFSTYWMSEEIQKKLLNYVNDGGKLVLYPVVPKYNLQGDECTILEEALEMKDWKVVKGFEQVDVLNIDSVFANQRISMDFCPGKPIAFASHKDKKEYAAFSKKIGKGSIIMLGIGLEQKFDYVVDVIRAVADEIGVGANISTSDNSLITSIRKGENSSFVFINNYDEIDRSGVVTYNDRLIFDGQEIIVPSRTGVILPLECQVFENMKIKYSTIEINDMKVEDNYFKISSTLSIEGNGEVLIETNSWIPIEKQYYRVEMINTNLYKIKVFGHPQDNVEIVLRKRVINNN